MKTATVVPQEINVRHSIRQDVQREFLTFSIKDWEEVSALTKKVLLFEGKRFTFSGWNSDTYECFFVKPLNKNSSTAKWL